MVVLKDPEAISRYYAPSFVMDSNGVRQEYAAFAKSHEGVYASEITYSVEYDESAWVESSGRVAGRMWITTKLPAAETTRIEVILVDEGRITRVWETTWPNWADLTAFDSYE